MNFAFACHIAIFFDPKSFMEGTVSSLTDLRIFAKQQLDCLSVGSVPPGLVQYRSPKPKILIKNVVVDATLGTTSKSGCELRDKSFGKSPLHQRPRLVTFAVIIAMLSTRGRRTCPHLSSWKRETNH